VAVQEWSSNLVSPSPKETASFSFQGGFNNHPKIASSGLLMDKTGNLYRTTLSGGNPSCKATHAPYCGTMYKLAKNGKRTMLYKFTGGSGGLRPLGP
jgi:hypothetical protein